MALPNTGITTYLVGNTLGTTSRNVSALCKHTNINKWAKGKPIPYASNTGVNDNDRKFANQGFDLNSVTSISIANLWNAANANKDWKYTPPTGGTSQPFRLGDFRGYNHSAVQPYNYNSFPVNVESYNNTCEVSFRILKDTNAELTLTDFAHFENFGSFSGWRYGIAYKHSSWNNADTRFMYGSSVTANTNEIIIEGTLPTPGTYQILPIITKETGTTTDALESIYLPNGLRSLTFTKKTAWATVTITNEYNISPSYYWDGYLYMFQNMIQLSVTNSQTGVSIPSTYGRLYFQIMCYDAYDNFIGEFKFTDDNNGSFQYSGSGAKSYTLDFNAGAPLYLPDYIGDYSSVNRIVIYADVERTSGSGVFQIAKLYQWECYKN